MRILLLLGLFGMSSVTFADSVPCKNDQCPDRAGRTVTITDGYVCESLIGEYFRVDDPACSGLPGSVSVPIGGDDGADPIEIAQDFFNREELPEAEECARNLCVTDEGEDGLCLEKSYAPTGTNVTFINPETEEEYEFLLMYTFRVCACFPIVDGK